MTTIGWFTRFSAEMLRLTHPASIGSFGVGIFAGTLLQILALLVTDISAIVATAANYRRLKIGTDGATMVCQLLGALFLLVGVGMMFAPGVDKYHNAMHMVWGACALALSLARSPDLTRRYCVLSGIFYLALGVIGEVAGTPSTGGAFSIGPMVLRTPDHVFHLLLASALVATGLLTGRAHLQISESL
jgi:hypothetical protein